MAPRTTARLIGAFWLIVFIAGSAALGVPRGPLLVVIGTVLLFVLTVGFGAAAFGARFRLYSIATMVLALVFGMLTGIQSPRLAANLPTPYIGLFERISIAVYMIWLMALAIALLRRHETASLPSARPSLREA